MVKKLICLILFPLIFWIPHLSAADDDGIEVKSIWGPYYRSNSFLPIKVLVKGKFRPYTIKNKISQDDLSYIDETVSSALLKMSSSATLLELINPNTRKNKFINLPLQILNQEILLIAVLGEEQIAIESKDKNIKIFETNLLPDTITGFHMIDLLIITKDYHTIPTSKQMDALKDWVYKGGTILFDSIDSLRIQGPLTIHLFKKLTKDPESFDQLKENEKKKLIGKIIKDMIKDQKARPILFGNAAILADFDKNKIQKSIDQFSHYTTWSKRNRNNSLINSKNLDPIMSNKKTSLTVYYIIIYFLIFLVLALLKPKKLLTRLTTLIAILAILPAVYYSPTNQINGYAVQMIEGSKDLKYTKIKNELVLQKGNIEKIEFELKDHTPLLPIDDAHIILHKNKRGQYVKQELKFKGQEIKLKKELMIKNKFFKYQKTEKQELLFHKQPIKSAFEVQEDTVRTLKTKTIKNNRKGILSEILLEKETKKRDDLSKRPWYALSNQYFYQEPPRTKKIKILNGSLDFIDIKTKPSFNFQRTQFTIIINH